MSIYIGLSKYVQHKYTKTFTKSQLLIQKLFNSDKFLNNMKDWFTETTVLCYIKAYFNLKHRWRCGFTYVVSHLTIVIYSVYKNVLYNSTIYPKWFNYLMKIDI